MARILDLFLNRTTNKSCTHYPDARLLVEGLRREEAAAIQCLSSKISGSVYRIGKGFQLVDDDIEELHCDCIMVFIEKIRSGKYEYQGYDPATYVIEIAKNKVRNFQRHAGKNASTDLTSVPDQPDDPDYGSLQQNLTQYSTVDALKNKRAECMRKLTEAATGLKKG